MKSPRVDVLRRVVFLSIRTETIPSAFGRVIHGGVAFDEYLCAGNVEEGLWSIPAGVSTSEGFEHRNNRLETKLKTTGLI